MNKGLLLNFTSLIYEQLCWSGKTKAKSKEKYVLFFQIFSIWTSVIDKNDIKNKFIEMKPALKQKSIFKCLNKCFKNIRDKFKLLIF